MKKAKIMLSVLGVLALVGSVFALKAHKTYSGTLRCSPFSISETTSATIAASGCTMSTYAIADPADGEVRFCGPTANPVAPCRATTYVTFDQ